MALQKKKISQKELDAQRERDHTNVRGVFRNMESKGGSVSFSFKKWKDDDLKHYELVDGQVYDLPLMVAQHLRDKCFVQEHTRILDMNGNPTLAKGRKHKRFTFEALSFDGNEETPTEQEA